MMTTNEATDPQRDVVALLAKPSTYGLPSGASIERLDTHISMVWLAGARAYKLKRAVVYDYVDFSTTALRHEACEAEVRLNRRTAPTLYRGVLAVTRETDGSLALDGRGEPVDWLVEMVRFDQDLLFDRLADRNRLDVTLMDGLADAIAALHAMAEPRIDRGGRENMAWVITGNDQAFADYLSTTAERETAKRLAVASRAVLEQQAELLDARRRGGFVRVCHGDLHLRNICLLAGVPTLFDGVEFNEQISCVDVWYDLAFLLMDLWHRDLKPHANTVFNGYLARTVDLGGLGLLPLFLSCRAAIRAKTAATTAHLQPRSDGSRDEMTAASQYVALAGALLHPRRPCLVAIGGFSGAGKSTLARLLAPGVGAAPGAVVLRSDVIRKQLLAVSPTTTLGPEAYSGEMTRRVYQTLSDRAKMALGAGHPVIADAVYANPVEREAIEAVARGSGTPFLGIWLDAPPDTLANRIAGRHTDASDATASVLERQLSAGAGSIAWYRQNAAGEMNGVLPRVEWLVRQLT